MGAGGAAATVAVVGLLFDADVGALRGVCVLVVVCFLIGIARAWEFVGGPSLHVRSQLAGALRDRERGEDRDPLA